MSKNEIALVILWASAVLSVAHAQDKTTTTTPIEHVVVIVGENMSFDALFGTYQPPQGQSVSNLLSRKIIHADGTPGPNYSAALQKIPATSGKYLVDYPESTAYAVLPRPYARKANGRGRDIDNSLPADLPPGPFQITRYRPYTEFTGSSPVHRFFQMWQQVNAGRKDLFVWTSMSSGEGSSDKANPANSTGLSSEAMAFYNMASGDVPYFNQLARTYSISDNYHQSIMGGTMANYFAMATGGDVIRYLKDGVPGVPPQAQIENPEPLPGSANWYTHSGYSSGSYTACADEHQPGVGAIRAYLGSLPYRVFNGGNCEAGTYYLVNNYSPYYSPGGSPQVLGTRLYVAPPQTAPTIAQALSAKAITWRWYHGGRSSRGVKRGDYSSDMDPLTFSKEVMETDLKKNLVSDSELFDDIKGQMPSVAFVAPPVSRTGHPASGTPAAFEAYAKGIVETIQANPKLWEKTAIFITTDEGGGYYDSGYIQPIDFFGDGTRIPLIAVSPWARPGYVGHTYYDSVSLLKFIERNWGLKPLSRRSRDNLPNPQASADPYVPGNRPALGDLFELFDFSRSLKN